MAKTGENSINFMKKKLSVNNREANAIVGPALLVCAEIILFSNKINLDVSKFIPLSK